MRMIESDPRLSTLSNVPNLNSLLSKLINQLAQCQNTLELYMAEKRSTFPRLFFLSDDDLLELLGQAKANSSNRENVLQSHIKKLFPGITGIALGPDAVSITAMKSQDGEKLVLDVPVDIESPIEIWLKHLENQMRESLHTCIKKCLLHLELQKNDLTNYPTQVLCLVQSIHFTENTERAILSHNLHSMKDNIRKELDKYLQADVHESGSNLTKSKLRALILQCYHHLQIIDELISNGVNSPNQWHWQKQLRYYVESKTQINGCMGLAKLKYTYEYLGSNTGTLVRTELTDQCFLTLTQALHLGMVGNLFGPAGTGKTESVKALGGLLGRLVLVFNCDEGMDEVTMGRLLSGLALCGAWGCFDEFNRLEENTLSAVGQQFSSILEAINPKIQQTIAIINGKEVEVSIGCGVFATMNPAGAKYGGRRKLPEGLNRLFRPCSMSQPHVVHITSALLAAQGYTNSKQMAEKLVLCFDMAKSLLSENHHYDWGLRALKTIIGSCGTALLESMSDSKKQPDEEQQTALIVQALKVNTLSKLSHMDYKRFENIVDVIFPSVKIVDFLSNNLVESLKDYCDAKNISISDYQIRKCTEIYNQLKQRMGVVIVGPPGSGKTFLRNILKEAVIKMGENISQNIICPKAMTRKDLLGFIDPDTRQWCDGVISTISLDVVNHTSDVWSWIVCDGDIDPEWIESLNSVLDDNRLLTLPSGWRIQYDKNVNFIFETHDLNFASPATITRMGIILLSDEESCYKELIQNWITDMRNSGEMAIFDENIFYDIFEKLIEWIDKNSNHFLVQYQRIPLTKQILSFFNNYDGIKSIEEYIAAGILQGMSCLLKPDALENFTELVSQWTNVSPHAIMWENLNSLQDFGPLSLGSDFFISNKRITRTIEVIKTWIYSNKHFMIFGPAASGKSMILDYLLKNMNEKVVITLKCTPIFDIKHIIQTLRQKSAVKSNGGKGGNRIVLVIKSLQRSVTDKWNTSIIQSFLLQLIHYGGFWEKSDETGSDGKMQWYTLQPFTLIVTATSEDNTLKLSPRLMNSLKIINIKSPDENELSGICETNLNSTLSKLNIKSKDKMKLSQFSSKMFSLFQEASKVFSNEIHYKWTSRDMIRWCQNLCYYKIDDINTLNNVILEEAVCLFKNRLMAENERNAFDVLIQKHMGMNYVQNQIFFPRIVESGFQLELIDENDYSLYINKTINQCNSEVENEYNIFGDSGIELCQELKMLISISSRILCTAHGAIVLVGSAGVGRRAAAKIAAEIINAKLMVISTAQQFSSNLKSILTTCGLDSQNIVVVLEESAASDNSILGIVETLLNNEENDSCLSIYVQEIETMISQMKTKNNERKTVENFLSNIRKHLGIIMLYDAKQYNLKNILSSYPLLYNQCLFYWLDKWNENTLKDISVQITKRTVSDEKELADCLNIISSGKILEMISSVNREDLNTPYRYVIFLKTYFNIYFEKKLKLEERRKRLQAGVSALTEAHEEVSRLKMNAAEQEKILAEKQTLANQALNQIGMTMQSATTHKQEMETLKSNAEVENVKLQQRKKEIEIELSEVEPIIQEARTAVGEIKSESLSEVRSLRAPPEPVRDVLEGVLRLMGIADTSWHSMKTFLSKRGIKDDIRLFDATNISQENLRAVEKLLASHSNSFNEKTAKRASVACAPLAAWVLANVKYANVLQKIAPLEAEQKALTRNLTNAELQIKNLDSNLSTVDEKVAALKVELNNYTKQATEIEINLSSVQKTVEKAEKLVLKLSQEFQRWNQNLHDLSKEFDEVCVRSMMMAGVLSFLTSEKEEDKTLIIKCWLKLFDNQLEDISIKEFFLTRNDEIKWIDKGISSNSISLCNGIVINEVLKESKCGLVPLVVDPNNECLTWLSNIIDKTPKDIVSQYDAKFSTMLQHALRFGKIFIIKDVMSIDDSWSSLLRGLVPLNMGVNSINPNFRLILISQNSKFPNTLPVYYKSLISIIDFTPQKQGLVDQLIFNAVKQEEPELQQKLSEINTKKDNLQVEQDELEVKLLSQLSSGNILHNPELLESLEYTQKAVLEVTTSLKEAAEIQSVIMDQCELYRPLANRIASSCLAISSLIPNYPLINISLDTAVKLFLKGLENFRGMMNKRDFKVENIEKYIIISLMERVLVALNKEFHSIVLLHLMHHIYPEHIPKEEWDVLICNPDMYVYGKLDEDVMKEIPRWMDSDRKPYLIALQTLVPELYTNLQFENENEWKRFISTGEWDFIPFPNRIRSFQKILIAWCLKPNKLYSFIMKVTAEILGTDKLYPSGDLINTVENWGSINQPILIVASAGTDPVDQIKSKALFKVGSNKYKQIWLTESAYSAPENITREIEWAEETQSWLVIMAPAGNWSQNKIYHVFSQLQQRGSRESLAKIWIVVENSSIPYQLSTCCVNVIIEAPTGIKNNLLRILSVWNSHRGLVDKTNNPKLIRLEFSLALAHSIIQQRCAYIPQGWRYQYEFSWGDLEASLAAIRETDRDIASGLCKAFYSGRINWEQDILLMSALLDKHFDESVLGHTWKPLGIELTLPMANKLQDYISTLSNFGLQDSPTLLNLPLNIQGMQEQAETDNALTHLQSLSMKESVEEYNNKALKKKIAPILSLWKKLNSGSQSLLKNKFDVKIDGDMNGLKALAFCELETATIAIQNIHKDLVGLHSSSVSVDDKIRKLASALISDKTPDSWMAYWSAGPSSASAFMTGLCERSIMAQKRIHYTANDKDSFVISLSSFLKPHCVIYALLWQASKIFSTAPENLKPIYKWNDNQPDLSIGKVILTDLWLEGAIWESGRLQPCRGDTSIQVKAPPISMCFISKDSDEFTNKSQVEIPIFTSRERKDIIFKINAPLAEQFNKNLWILNSTALII